MRLAAASIAALSLLVVFQAIFAAAQSALPIDSDRDSLRLFLQDALPAHAAAAEFNLSDSPCRWPGITCSGSGNLERVQKVDIQGIGLRGSIPQGSIGKLDALVHLSLFNNSISGTLPTDVWGLPNLQYLNLSANALAGSITITSAPSPSLLFVDLSQNKLSGQISGTIGSLGGVLTLNLSRNDLQDGIPSSLFNCTLLQQLDLSHNKLTGSIPAGLARITKLQALVLSSNSLQDAVPADVGRLHYLSVLDLSVNQFTGPFPRLDGLRKLEILNVSSNLLTGGLPQGAFRLPGLKFLAARENKLVGGLPAPSAKASNLTVIDVGRNSLSGNVSAGIWNLSSLEVLRLDGNNLSGQLPLQLGAGLKELDLRSNLFNGEVPSDMGGYQGLVFLDVSSNRLSGRLPQKLTSFPFLVHLGLANNPFLESRFPEIGGLQRLEYLNLSAIQLVGRIPGEIGSVMHRLQQLDLSHNELNGSIPASLGDLGGSLVSLDLSYNHLDGGIPASLGKLGALRDANFSYNELSGEVPAWPFLGVSGLLGNRGVCGPVVNVTCPASPPPPPGTRRAPPPPSHGRGWSHRRRMRTALIVGIVTGSAAAILCLVAGIIYCRNSRFWLCSSTSSCCCCFVSRKTKGPPKEERYISMSGPFSSEMDPSVWAAGVRDPQNIPVVMFEKPLLSLTFADLMQATSNLNKEAQLPDGGWGPVFRGDLPGGIHVVVKILGEGIACASLEEAAAQLAAIGRLKHPNVAPLLGYCMVGVERLLVYEYVQENGDLYGWLHELPEGVPNPEDWTTDTWEHGVDSQGQQHPRMSWAMRHKVALGTARALAFLHHGCSPPVIHRDLKAGNVLLDAEFEPRLAGTGLAELVEMGAGEVGYVPPESSGSREPSTKGDVYAFGVVLLELVTGKRPVGDDYMGDGNYGGSLVAWTRSLIKEKRGFKALDVRVMKGDEEMTEMLETLRVAYLCTADSAGKRPTMQQVVGLLKDLRPGVGSGEQGSL